MNKNIKYTLLAMALGLVLSACSNTVVEQKSNINIPVSFEQVEDGISEDNLQSFWENFNDQALNQLIEKGLKQNLDYKFAKARLDEAQANYDYKEADKGLNVSANGSLIGGASHISLGNMDNNIKSSTGGIYGGISASWEFDFFGKKQSDADSAKSLVLAQKEQIYATNVLIASQIAQNYFLYQATIEQQNLIYENINNLKKLERYVKGRFDSGQTTSYELTEIQAQIANESARIALFDSNRDFYKRQLAVLLGENSQEFNLEFNSSSLNSIPKAPLGQKPSDVIERRPDLRSAHHQLDSKAALLASAKADLYPRFNISFMGQGGYIKLDNDLSKLSGLNGLVSLGVQLPIFTNGRIQANIDAADASLKASLINYDKTLLQALAEVENSYQKYYGLKEQKELTQQALKLSLKKAKDANLLYQYNDKSLDVALRAKSEALNQEERLLQTKLNHALSCIELYKAIGGGWSEE